MNGNKKNKWENYMITAILVCAGLVLLFSGLTIKNVLSGNEIMEQADALEERLEALKVMPQETELEFAMEDAKNAPQTGEISEPEAVWEEETKSAASELEIGETAAQESTGDLDLSSFLEAPKAMGEQWAVSVLDLSDGAAYGVNEDVSMQSASVIKVFIMATVYDRICYPEDPASAIYAPEQYEGELKDLLVNMITVSDNEAANRLVELLGNGDFQAGQEIVNDYCQQNGYTGTSLGRRFLEENPQGDNYTTAADCRKILQDIYNGTCVGEEASEKMLDILEGQTIKTKISQGIPASVLSANKTGEMPEGYGLGCIENDIAIVYGENGDYILCVLSNNLGGRNEEAKVRIAEISGYIYGEMQ